MGGSIGIQPEMVRRVSNYLVRCTPLQVRLEASDLGARAQLVGALKAGMEQAYDKVFGIAAMPVTSGRFQNGASEIRIPDNLDAETTHQA